MSLRQCRSTPLRKDAAGISPRLSRLPCQHSPARVVVSRHSPSPQQIVTSNSLDCKTHKRYHIISLIIKIFDSKTKSSLKLAHNAVQPHCAYRGTGHAGKAENVKRPGMPEILAITENRACRKIRKIRKSRNHGRHLAPQPRLASQTRRTDSGQRTASSDDRSTQEG